MMKYSFIKNPFTADIVGTKTIHPVSVTQKLRFRHITYKEIVLQLFVEVCFRKKTENDLSK